MEGASAKDVLSHLSLLEAQAKRRKAEPPQPSRVKQLQAKVAALTSQRDQLKAEIQLHKTLENLRASMDKQSKRGGGEEEVEEEERGREGEEEEEEMDVDPENLDLLQLMARHTQLRDLLHAYEIIGGYNIVETRQGKGACVTLATSYEGVYLETYNLELELRPTLRIIRHNVPPFIPLKSLTEQSNAQSDISALLDVVSQHLNAYAGRRQQVELVKVLHTSVTVMESNLLCSILRLLFKVPKGKTTVLCSLDYTDHTRYFPTRVHFESEDRKLPDSPEWKQNCSLLMETPLHKALTTMKTMMHIV